jgi:hypothetical protein
VATISLENDVHWEGECIVVWASTEQGRVQCKIPRDTIHCIPRFRDAISREIVRDRNEIVDRLRPILIAKVAAGSEDGTIVLLPQDLQSA